MMPNHEKISTCEYHVSRSPEPQRVRLPQSTPYVCAPTRRAPEPRSATTTVALLYTARNKKCGGNLFETVELFCRGGVILLAVISPRQDRSRRRAKQGTRARHMSRVSSKMSMVCGGAAGWNNSSPGARLWNCFLSHLNQKLRSR